MFSYTDDAIVTSSPTGRHLSTVIRRPAGMPDNGWTQHADQVCKVLNELDSKAKAHSLSLHLQTVGRVERIDKLREQYAEVIKRGFAQDAAVYGGQSPLSFVAVPPAGPMPLATRIAELEQQISSLETECLNTRDRLSETEKQLDDANGRLAADILIELSDNQLREAYAMPAGRTMSIKSQRVIIKRVE